MEATVRRQKRRAGRARIGGRYIRLLLCWNARFSFRTTPVGRADQDGLVLTPAVW